MNWYSFSPYNGWLWLGASLLACLFIVAAFWSWVWSTDSQEPRRQARWAAVSAACTVLGIFTLIFILGLLFITAS